MYLTLQGEGANSGLAVVLLRFQGCNLKCSFCDTDFEGTDGPGGGVFVSPASLADAVKRTWRNPGQSPRVLCTGGEPLLQLDRRLLDEFHGRGFFILVETNGTIPAPEGIDWLCVSPKQKKMEQNSGNEIKVVWPQDNLDPEDFRHWSFSRFYIQPKYDGNYAENVRTAVEYCIENPQWRLSLQIHRYCGIK